MLKIAVFLIAAFAAPCIVRAAPYALVYIWGDPHIYSVNAGYETCSSSSSEWVQSFFSRRISIDSNFRDLFPGQQHPTVQKSFRVTFSRPGPPGRIETYNAPNPSYPFPGQFASGSVTTGWVNIVWAGSTFVIIADFSTGSIFFATRSWNIYNLFLLAPYPLIQRGGGLLVDGCPYKDTWDYGANAFLSPYNANPNWGRKKRQIGECDALANEISQNFPEFKSFSADIVRQICNIDSEFLKDGAIENIKVIIEATQKAKEFQQKLFPDGYVAEADKDYEDREQGGKF